MPWLETSPVDQRARFIRDHQGGLYAMAERCARYGISRQAGYRWLARVDEAGRLGLQDRSRAPHHCPHRIPDEVADVIGNARRQHPPWGPEKLLAWLAPRRPDLALPASAYQAAPRVSTGARPPVEYPGPFLVTRSTSAATFRFTPRLLVLAHALEPHLDRPRGGRRWHLVDSRRPGAPRSLGRTRLCH